MAAEVSGFTVFPVIYSSSTTHYLYLKAHSSGKSSSKDEIPSGRTLFVVNIPPDTTEQELSSLFKHHGLIERILFDATSTEDQHESHSDDEMEDGNDQTSVSSPTNKKSKKDGQATKKKPIVTPLPSASLRTLRPTGKSAYIIYIDDSSLQKAMSVASSGSSPPKWPSSSEPRGLAHYIALHSSLRPPLSAIREYSDTSLELYDYEQEEKKLRARSQFKKGEAIVDEDGFTLVTRGGAYGQTLGGGVGVASKKFEQEGGNTNSRKKKDPKEKKMFYAFQANETKRNDLIQLKRNWEADKAKITKLRQERKFKPY